MNDPIGDMLTRIRNASLRGKSTVDLPRKEALRIRVSISPIGSFIF